MLRRTAFRFGCLSSSARHGLRRVASLNLAVWAGGYAGRPERPRPADYEARAGEEPALSSFRVLARNRSTGPRIRRLIARDIDVLSRQRGRVSMPLHRLVSANQRKPVSQRSSSDEGALRIGHAPGSIVSAAAFSSQNRMSMSRYIVVAMVRCS
jgi:hypothetical protein